MPVEIKELQIRVTVNEPSGATQSSAPAASSNNGDEKEAIINQCIEQVMEILNNKKER